ncbi:MULTISPECIES: hypothetical protein [unclassified Methylobacterium]|uniref:hypothetical protein n=1 Tax=unclassified Methylobacterium TaxID=2615210 RepID=UPI0006F4CB03|nr:MULTISPECIES: hypothetical protein [unclassified Methylobacterium]KQO54358.1 hypothetical protein ASF24_21210 [Methylobacterium sp. Leaf86]KQO90337.1 hypothetical protein ASF32_05025 [Methylobacterium sp. Leaf91]
MRKSFTVFAALIAASLTATPFVMGASNALATTDKTDLVAMPAMVTPIEVASVPAPALPETCTRKVRVVYSGYGAPSSACTIATR